jgi:hypothetical protein
VAGLKPSTPIGHRTRAEVGAACHDDSSGLPASVGVDYVQAMQVLKHEIVRPLRFVASEWGKNIGCGPWSTGKVLDQIFDNQKSMVLGPGMGEVPNRQPPKGPPLDILYNILLALAAFSLRRWAHRLTLPGARSGNVYPEPQSGATLIFQIL